VLCSWVTLVQSSVQPSILIILTIGPFSFIFLWWSAGLRDVLNSRPVLGMMITDRDEIPTECSGSVAADYGARFLGSLMDITSWGGRVTWQSVQPFDRLWFWWTSPRRIWWDWETGSSRWGWSTDPCNIGVLDRPDPQNHGHYLRHASNVKLWNKGQSTMLHGHHTRRILHLTI